jgi:hypothetical protein
VQLINPGTSGGALYADVYVFDPAEELKECCALPISTDGGFVLQTSSSLAFIRARRLLTDFFKPPRQKCLPGFPVAAHGAGVCEFAA